MRFFKYQKNKNIAMGGLLVFCVHEKRRGFGCKKECILGGFKEAVS